MKALVLLNRRASSGKALRLWKRCAERVRGALPEHELDLITDAIDWRRCLREEVDGGCRLVIAAGGDGTIGYVVRLLQSLDEDVVFGAIAAGSNCDYHKAEGAGGEIPLCVDAANVRRRNLIRVEYARPDGSRGEGLIHTHASIGMIAQANHLYGRRIGLTGLLRGVHAQASVISAALLGLASHHPIPVELTVDGRAVAIRSISNASILLSPHLPGGISFPDAFGPYDETMTLKVHGPMPMHERLAALDTMTHRRDRPIPHERNFRCREIEIRCRRPVMMELDGETVRIIEARFELLRAVLPACGPLR